MEYANVAADRLKETLAEDEQVTLMRTWLQDHPHRPAPYEVIVGPHSVPVYALIGYLEVAKGDLCKVAEAYDVPLDAVKAAVVYYSRYPEIITARVDANNGVSYLSNLN